VLVVVASEHYRASYMTCAASALPETGTVDVATNSCCAGTQQGDKASGPRAKVVNRMAVSVGWKKGQPRLPLPGDGDLLQLVGCFPAQRNQNMMARWPGKKRMPSRARVCASWFLA
jgi:hypothetical protein